MPSSNGEARRIAVEESIPCQIVRIEEQLQSAKKKKEEAEREIAELEAKEKAAIAAMPTKGFPASFFEPTAQQLQFL